MTIYCNVSGTWREVATPYVNVSGTWREVQNAYANVSGTWRETYSAAPPVSIGDYYEGGFYAGEYGGNSIIAPRPADLNSVNTERTWSDAQTWCSNTFSAQGYSDWQQANYWQLDLVCDARLAINYTSSQKYTEGTYWSSTYQSPYYYRMEFTIVLDSCTAGASLSGTYLYYPMPIRVL